MEHHMQLLQKKELLQEKKNVAKHKPEIKNV